MSNSKDSTATRGKGFPLPPPPPKLKYTTTHTHTSRQTMKLSTAISFLPLVAGFTSPSISTRSNVVVASPLKPAFYVARGGSQDHINASTSQSTTASISLASSSTSIESDIGPSLSIISQGNWDLLSARGKAALSRLILWDMASGGGGQKHVYGDWPEVGVEDEEKRMLAEQVRCVVCVNLVHMHRIDIDGIVLYVLQISSHPLCQQQCCSHITFFLSLRLQISTDPTQVDSLPTSPKPKPSSKNQPTAPTPSRNSKPTSQKARVSPSKTPTPVPTPA